MSKLIKVIGSDGSSSIAGASLKSFYEEKNALTPSGTPKPYKIEDYEEPEEEAKPVAVTSAIETEKQLAAEKERNDALQARLDQLEEMLKQSTANAAKDTGSNANAGGGKGSKANAGGGK